MNCKYKIYTKQWSGVYIQLQSDVPDLLLSAWYLDDGLLVGKPQDLLKAFKILQEASLQIGLKLSLTKSTFWRPPSCRPDVVTDVSPPPPTSQRKSEEAVTAEFNIPEAAEDGIILLGVPVGLPGFCISAISKHMAKTVHLMEHL